MLFHQQKCVGNCTSARAKTYYPLR